MLSRLQESLARIASLWRSQSSQLQLQIAETLETLSKELKVTYDPDGQPREIWGHASRRWTNVRDKVSQKTSDIIYSSVFPSFMDAIYKKPNNVAAMVNAPDEDRPHESKSSAAMTTSWLQTVLEAGYAVAHESALAENLPTDNDDKGLDAQQGSEFSSFDDLIFSADFQNLDVKLLGDKGAIRKLLILPEGELDDSTIERLKNTIFNRWNSGTSKWIQFLSVLPRRGENGIFRSW